MLELGRLSTERAEMLLEQDPVVVFPVGAFEQHGPHLPLLTDTIIAEAICRRAVEAASARATVLLMPPIWVGASSNHLDFAGTLSVSDELFVRYVAELLMCQVSHGLKRFFLLNAHGRNLAPLQLAARSVRDQTDGTVLVAVANYWHLIPEVISEVRESPIGGMAHACEFETSAMLHIDPTTVEPSRAKSYVLQSKTKHLALDFLSSGRVSLAFHSKDLTPSGVIGDAEAATADKGRLLVDAASEAVAAFIVEFASWTYDSLFHVGGSVRSDA